MGVIQGAVDGFILTVGITPPTPQQKHAATIFIATGLIGTIAGIAIFFVFLVSRIFAH